MIKINPIKKNLSIRNRKIAIKDHSKLLAEFFNGVAINMVQE